MNVSRLDLDGTGSPEGLVTKILKAEPNLTIPVPITELAAALDIAEINPLESDGFEGGLLTDTNKAKGIILVNGSAPRQRQRFTIGHELAHFLIPLHKPVRSDRFLCSTEDMRCWTAAENDRYQRMEMEANRFAALILMPPPFLRVEMQRFQNPDLMHVADLARRFDVSKEAAARSYANFHEEAIAIVVVKDGRISRAYKHTKFPRIAPSYGQPVPQGTLFHRATQPVNTSSDIALVDADRWLESDLRSRRTLYEQIYPQQNGYAMILLHLETVDEDEAEEERSLEDSWKVGFGKRR